MVSGKEPGEREELGGGACQKLWNWTKRDLPSGILGSSKKTDFGPQEFYWSQAPYFGHLGHKYFTQSDIIKIHVLVGKIMWFNPSCNPCNKMDLRSPPRACFPAPRSRGSSSSTCRPRRRQHDAQWGPGAQFNTLAKYRGGFVKVVITIFKKNYYYLQYIRITQTSRLLLKSGILIRLHYKCIE